MKSLLMIIVPLVICTFVYHPALANTCSDYKKKTDLDLNSAECYVLERVESGNIAHFKESEKENAAFQEGFTRKKDRTIGAAFLKDLISGNLSNLNGTKNGSKCQPKNDPLRQPNFDPLVI